MSNLQTVKLELEGNVPSKKNSRIHTRAGVSIPSQAFRDWQDSALWQVRRQTKARLLRPVAIEVVIYFATLRKSDIDNKLTSILDMLVESLVIRDDKWQYVPKMSVEARYRKGEPGASVTITELDVTL